jgi:hypothetical protein
MMRIAKLHILINHYLAFINLKDLVFDDHYTVSFSLIDLHSNCAIELVSVVF